MSDESAPPAEVVVRPEVAVGANLAARVRLLRAGRGWSLKRLSERSGVSKSMLSQVERGEANPTVVVALAIATALGVTVDDLLVAAQPTPALYVVRADDPQFIHRSDEYVRIRTLSPLSTEPNIEFYEICLQRDGALRSAPHFSGTVEYLTVRSGAVRVESGDQRVDLGAGDSTAYAADVTHAIVNLRRTQAVLYLVDASATSED